MSNVAFSPNTNYHILFFFLFYTPFLSYIAQVSIGGSAEGGSFIFRLNFCCVLHLFPLILQLLLLTKFISLRHTVPCNNTPLYFALCRSSPLCMVFFPFLGGRGEFPVHVTLHRYQSSRHSKTCLKYCKWHQLVDGIAPGLF